MPVRPRKEITRRASGGGLTWPELADLIQGFCFFDEPFFDDQARRKCWKTHCKYIMGLQGKDVQGEAFGLSQGVYFDFGTRPAAWWKYEAPGPRRFISCTNDFCPYFSECPVAQNIPTETPQCVIRKGEQHIGGSFEGLYRLECVGHKFKIFLPQRETEAAFLQRHGLLNEAETRYIEEAKATNNRP